MDHAQAIELFSAYAESELPPEQAREVEQHLQSCIPCRREYGQFQRLMAGLHSLPRVTAPPEFVQGVVVRVRKRSGGRFFAPRRLVDRIPYEMFSLLMLGLLLALYLVLQLSQPGHLQLP